MIKIIIISKDENSKSIEYILKKFSTYEVYLVSPLARSSKYESNNLYKINDNELLDFNELKNSLKLERFGWYYQQFLKYQSILNLEGEDFLIIDGDTFINENLLQKDTLFTTNKNTVEGYSCLYKLLFPEHNLNGKSFITNQMIFKKKYLKEIIKNIEKNSSKSWIESLAELVKYNHSCMFSEYQVYAEYIINMKYDVDIKNTTVFRRMDLINDSVENALDKYDIVAYESHHNTGFLRLIRAKIYYLLGLSIG
jgi:hypothetical protein